MSRTTPWPKSTTLSPVSPRAPARTAAAARGGSIGAVLALSRDRVDQPLGLLAGADDVARRARRRSATTVQAPTVSISPALRQVDALDRSVDRAQLAVEHADARTRAAGPAARCVVRPPASSHGEIGPFAHRAQLCGKIAVAARPSRAGDARCPAPSAAGKGPPRMTEPNSPRPSTPPRSRRSGTRIGRRTACSAPSGPTPSRSPSSTRRPTSPAALHIGHALDNTLQDIVDPLRAAARQGRAVGGRHRPRRHRHADGGRAPARERSRTSAPTTRREEFVAKVWEWKAESGGTITGQLRRLGCSMDWSREQFTMDPHFTRAVVKVFVDLYNQGLIYRDKRLVNWDPKLKTAISDLEVETQEIKGDFWHFRYPLADGVTLDDGATTSSSPPPGPRRCWPTWRWRCSRRPALRARSIGKDILPAAHRPPSSDRRRRARRSRARLAARSRSPRGTTSTTSKSASAPGFKPGEMLNMLDAEAQRGADRRRADPGRVARPRPLRRAQARGRAARRSRASSSRTSTRTARSTTPSRARRPRSATAAAW